MKIEDYALIGDCQSAALVGRNGSIDWLCWPPTMHVVRLLAPALDGEDYMKGHRLQRRWDPPRREAGLADARDMIERAPWNAAVDPMEGVVVHEFSTRKGD